MQLLLLQQLPVLLLAIHHVQPVCHRCFVVEFVVFMSQAGEAARLSVLGVYDEVEAAHKLSEHQVSCRASAPLVPHKSARATSRATSAPLSKACLLMVIEAHFEALLALLLGCTLVDCSNSTVSC